MKVVFVLDSIDAPHILKRINEFVENGFEVEVYGFKHFREKSLPLPYNFKINIIGEINHANYWLRIRGIVEGLRTVLKQLRGQKVLYYLVSLDVAMFFKLMCREDYVYEESDLKHTYVNNKVIQWILEKIDRRIIRKSVVSAFTSEGFVQYHFGDNPPKNICYVFNKLNKSIIDLHIPENKNPSIEHLKFAFVGKAQFKSTFAFAQHIVKNYRNHEMHFYGTTDTRDDATVAELKQYDNCFFHGRFNNPQDLPSIYENIDIVIALYDVASINVLYAEPNKLYEAIYFRKPILVSTGTFLAQKVNKLGIGFDIDALSATCIDTFIESLSSEKIIKKKHAADNILRSEAINDNSKLLEAVKRYIDSYEHIYNA